MTKKLENTFKLSVITVVFNDRQNVAHTLQSVKQVKTSALQYIVVDGGSTDGTVQVVEQFKDIIDVFISESDSGIYDAMNKGLRLAEGDSLIFMNSGDIFHPQLNLQRFIDKYDLANKIVLGFSIQQFKNSYYLRPTKTNVKHLIDYPAHQAIFVPRKCYENSTYNTNLKIAADYYWIKAMMKQCEYIVADEIISIFGLGGKSSSKKFNDIYLMNKEMQMSFPFILATLKYLMFNILGEETTFYILYRKKYQVLNSLRVDREN